MKRIIYIFLLSLSSISVFALGDKDKSEGKSNVKTAEKALEVGDKYQAIDIYEKILSKNNDIATAYKLGMLYFDIRDYKNAERCFEIASKESMINPQPLAAYYFALMQKMNGKYAEAKKSFETFKKSIKNHVDAVNTKLSNRRNIADTSSGDLYVLPPVPSHKLTLGPLCNYRSLKNQQKILAGRIL